MKQLFLLIYMLVAAATVVTAQQKPKPAAPKKPAKPVQIKTKVQALYAVKDNAVKIRWAPVNEEGWRLGNKYGYILERRTIMRDEKLLGGATTFRSYLMQADSLQYWEPVIDSNNNAAVMAQAMYGESFDLDVNGGAGAAKSMSLLGRAEEGKQRFLFAMYAADNDFGVAERAGLAFYDTAVKANEKYFYRIYPAAPKALVKSDTALLFVSMLDTMRLPQAPEILAEPSKQSVVLTWDMHRTRSYYNAYFIERSGDGGNTFTQLNDIPYTSFMQSSEPGDPNTLVYADTGLVENIKYQYRVCGVTIFGEKGPWSPVTESGALHLLEGVPGIQGIALTPEGKAQLNWYFEDSVRSKIKGFEITASSTGQAPFYSIVAGIAPDATSVLLPDTLTTAYLVVKAVSKEGLSRTSFPYLYQAEDSIPPATPKGLTAIADTTGRVTLSWMPGPEKDLMGYKVFRTLVKGDEFAILVDTIWRGTTFYDTLDLKLKNSKAYYSVAALDYRSNQSLLSKEVEVTKPDIIPPTAPVFADYKLTEGKVELEWINSTDEDITLFMLQRKEPGAADWKTIFENNRNDVTRYTDKDVQADKKYSYRLLVKDGAGHLSPEAQLLTVQTLPVVERKIIKEVESAVDREKRMIYLRWQYAEKMTVKSVEIYRGDEKEPMSLYKVLDGKSSELLDDDLLVNTKYKYGIRAVLPNGQYSDIITKEVNY